MFNPLIVCAYLYIISRYGYPPPAAETLLHLQEMKKLGFQSVELEGIREEHISDMYELRYTIRMKLDELQMQVPYFCAVLPGLTSLDKNVRRRNLELFEKGCEIARLFGAQGILDNAPVPPYQFPENIPVARHYDDNIVGNAVFPNGISWDEFWKQMVDTYKEICTIAERYDLTYQIHPAVGCVAGNTDGFINFHRAVGRDNLRFNFDTANLFAIKENLMISLLRLGSFIDYIHLSDNTGSRIEHLVPGDGNIRWELFFKTLDRIEFSGHIALDIGGEESKVDDIDIGYIRSAQWLTRHWIEK
jgi:sugar phosphate isomerase/epimerase